MSNNSIEKNIYLLYIFLLPFGKLFHLDEIIHTQYMFVNISTFVMLFGVAVTILEGGAPVFPHMKKWWSIYFFYSIYSVICACVFFYLGTVADKTTFNCIPRSIVLNFFAILTIYYNSVAFSRFIKFEDLVPLVKKQNFILLTLGGIQLGLLNGIPGCAQINDALGAVFSILPSAKLISGDRGITLFGSEPSSLGALMIVTIPFIFAIDIKEQKWKRTILWTLIFFTSGSTQALLMYFIGFAVAMYVRFRKNFLKIFFVGSFCLGMFMAFFYAYGIDATKKVTNDGTLSYIVYGKLVDVDNHSTATRVSTIINDVKIFANFPITGVGDGLQAFFFKENIPWWCANAEEVQVILRGKQAASGGGNFFASHISAYGLIGIFVLLLFIKQYRKDIDLYLMTCDDVITTTTMISFIIFLSSGWYTITFHNNEYVPLMLSLPYLGLSLQRQKNI